MNSPLPEPSQATSRLFEATLRSVSIYRRYVPNRSLPFFEMFLLVAARRQIRPSDIANILGKRQPSISAAMDNLGKGGRALAGFGINFGLGADVLGFAPDPTEHRAKLVELTERGRELAAEMQTVLGSGMKR